MVLSPHLLKGHQQFAKEQLKCSEEKPLYLVMHGGSGSSEAEIREAVRRQKITFGQKQFFPFQVSNGVVKMNVDTDTQWAYWDGLRGFYKKNEGYLQGQVNIKMQKNHPPKTYYMH